jgi:hypothetical protein
MKCNFADTCINAEGYTAPNVAASTDSTIQAKTRRDPFTLRLCQLAIVLGKFRKKNVKLFA